VLERLFKLTENHTTVQRELLGGLTTFITMAYIIVVNPRILAEGGMPIEGVVFATCVSAAVATLVMGLWANYPIALAPGMSLNAYFTYSIVIGRGIPWTTALGVVFFSGLLFLVLTLTRVREQVVNGIPDCLKHGTAAGIGLFIAFVGLRSAKLVVAHPATFVALGSFSDPQVQVATFGLVLTAALMARRINAAILLGIFSTTVVGILRGLAQWPRHFVSLPHPSGTLLKLDLAGAARLGLVELIFAFFFVDLFDNVGTLVGVRGRGLHARRYSAARQPRPAGRCYRDSFRFPDGNLHRHQLHRKRRRCGRWRPHGPGQRGDCSAISGGPVLLAARKLHPGLCYRPGAYPRGGVDVPVCVSSALGRLQ